MKTLIVKVDTKKNQDYLKELLQKFDFVVEVGEETSLRGEGGPEPKNMAGFLKSFADISKIEEETEVWEKVINERHGLHRR